MASLQKLSIRGVRSFSPEDDEQVIEFYSPLTIIVGSNGCGKTTIIESLKYAVTGALPPGVRSGQSFVHDPRSINQSSVKANIKLRFNNKAGRTMVVIRSMEVTQKKTSMTFKALDGVLRSTSSSGEKVSLSHKCSELDKQIPDLIGVSKPILEHVVFCHQEDSSWPLQEGAVLKKRFDEIFDSTRYAKALEAIRKSKTEYTALKNKINADLEGLKAHKQAADGLNVDLEEAEDKLKALDEKKEKYDEESEVEEGKKKVFEETLQGNSDLDMQLHDRKKAFEQAKEIAITRQGMLEEELVDEEVDTLKQMLLSFDETTGNLEGNFKAKMDGFEKLKSNLADLQSNRISKCSRLGTLNAAAEQNQVATVQRDSLITSIAQKHEIALPSCATDASYLNPNQLKVAMSSLKGKETEFSARLADLKKANQVADDDVQTRLGALLAESKHIESSRASNAEKTRELNGNLTQFATQSQSDRRISKAEVDDLVREAAALAEDRDKLSTNTRLALIPKEIKGNDQKIHNLQLEMEEHDEALDQLRMCADEENAVAILIKQVYQEVFRLSESCKDFQHRYPNFSDDLSNISAADLPTLESAALAIGNRAAGLEQDLASKRESHATKEKELTQKSTLLKHNQSNVTNLSARVADLRSPDSAYSKVIDIAKSMREEEVASMGDSIIPEDVESVDIEQLLNTLQDYLKAISTGMELFSPESVRRFMKKLKKLAKVTDDNRELSVRCPCCHSTFGAGTEEGYSAEKFEEMQAIIAQLASDESPLIKAPSEADKAKKKQFEDRIGIIMASMGDWTDLKRLEKEQNEIKKLVETDMTKVESYKNEASELKREIDVMVSKLADVDCVKAEVLKLRDTGTRISDKQGEVDQKKASLAAFAPSSEGKTLREVEKELKEGAAKKDALMRNTQDLNKEMAAINRNLQVATTRASQAEKIANEKRALYEKYGENETKRVTMREELAKCNEIERELNEKEAPVRQKLQEVEAEKARLRESSRRKEKDLSDELADYSKSLAEVHSYHDKVSQFVDGGTMNELDDLNAQITSVEKDISDAEAEVKRMEPEIADERSKMGDQSRQKKIIADNISYRESMAKVTEIEEEIKEIESEIGKIEGQAEAEEGFEACNERISELNNKKHRLSGKNAALMEQAEQLKRKLNSSTYKGIEDKHRQCMISFETTKIAVSDLDKYFQAVDKALLRYHSMKIGDINKIIKELWSLTYKGADITNIKIVSGADSKAKRSYNYRVVMSKGNTEMDMRGRCSAGQRVLASIVIRLALAETFCINCGVLALDEPTTNLDHDNKRGLAMALAQIIASRSGQHNFQLLAITHDEDFCDMMKNELASVGGKFSMPDSYFYVQREEGADGKHYSRIDKVSWDEL